MGRGSIWTEEETKFLIENYHKGPVYCSEKLSKSYYSVKSKAKFMNICDKRNFWTKEDDQWLIDNIHMGCSYCAERLNRTINSIRNRTKVLKIKIPHEYKRDDIWTDEEIKILVENYPNIGPSGCAKFLNRTPKAICTKAVKLNIGYLGNKFTKEEDDFILANRGIISNVEIAKILQRPSEYSIIERYNYLIRNGFAEYVSCQTPKYSNEEDNFIAFNYHHMQVQEIAESIGRTKESVATRIAYLKAIGTIRSPKLKRFTSKEDKYIIDHISSMSVEQIALNLNRSSNSIRGRIRHFGLSIKRIKNYTDEEKAFIIQNIHHMTRNHIAIVLNRSESGIEYCIHCLREEGLIPSAAKIVKLPWSEEEIEILRKFYPIMGSRCVEYLPLRNIKTVQRKASSCNISYNRHKS